MKAVFKFFFHEVIGKIRCFDVVRVHSYRSDSVASLLGSNQ